MLFKNQSKKLVEQLKIASDALIIISEKSSSRTQITNACSKLFACKLALSKYTRHSPLRYNRATAWTDEKGFIIINYF